MRSTERQTGVGRVDSCPKRHPRTTRIPLVVLLGALLAAIFVAGSMAPQAAGADPDEVPVTVTFMRYIEIEKPDPFGGTGDYYAAVCWDRVCDVGEAAQVPDGTTPVHADDTADVQPFSTLTRTFDRNAQTTATVNLHVWDHDPSANAPDDVMDINPVDDAVTLTFSVDLSTGSWTETSGAILPNVGFAQGDGDTDSANSPWAGGGGEAGRILFDISLSDDGDGDDDGIPDGVERTGVRDRNGQQVANMAALGADPCRKTVAVEMDFMESQAVGHTHRPQQAAITEIQNAFKNAPVAVRSPCPYSAAGFPKTDPGFSAQTGINLILHEDDAITEQSTLPGVSSTSAACGALDTIRGSFFQPARRRYFHYMVWVHDLGPGITNAGVQCSGQDPYGPGTDFLVSLGSWTNSVGTVREQSGAFMHELGHALGLGHGGSDEINFKPNYLSVMNYHFAAVGIRNGANLATAATRVDYSRQALAALDETALVETAGIGDGLDWTRWFDGADGARFDRGDGGLDWDFSSGGRPPFNAAPVAADVNGDTACVRFGRDGTSDTTVAGDDTVTTAGNPPAPVSPIRVGPNRVCDSRANSSPTPAGSRGDDVQVPDPLLPCVLPGTDGIDTWWQGDDRRRWSLRGGYYITYGANLKCDSPADPADIQATPVGQSVPTIPLAGFDDWANLRYAYSLGNIGAPPSQGFHADMTYEEALESEAFWQDAATVPSAALATPQTLTGSVTAAFSEPVQGVTDQNFVLRLDGTKVDLAATVSCRDGSGAEVACSSKEVSSAELAPAGPLTPGEHYEALLSPPGASSAITDSPGNAVLPAAAAFRASPVEDEGSVAADYSWQTISDAKAQGGSYVREHLRAATASFRFRGGSVTWFAVTGPDRGLADVYVDGVLMQTVDLYSPATQHGVAQSIGGLSPDPHTLTIKVVGAKGTAASKDTFVTIDALLIDDDRLDTTPAFDFTWQPSDAFEDLSGSRYVRSHLSSADVEFTFRGPGITWFTVKGPDQGSAELYVDGVKHSTVSNYASTRQLAAPVKVLGLSDAVHTLRIVVPPYASSFVSVDGWRVH